MTTPAPQNPLVVPGDPQATLDQIGAALQFVAEAERDGVPLTPKAHAGRHHVLAVVAQAVGWLADQPHITAPHTDPWIAAVRDWLAADAADHYTADEILVGAIEDIGPGEVTRAHQNRLAKVMQALGWSKARRHMAGGRRYFYRRPRAADLATQHEGTPA